MSSSLVTTGNVTSSASGSTGSAALNVVRAAHRGCALCVPPPHLRGNHVVDLGARRSWLPAWCIGVDQFDRWARAFGSLFFFFRMCLQKKLHFSSDVGRPCQRRQMPHAKTKIASSQSPHSHSLNIFVECIPLASFRQLGRGGGRMGERRRSSRLFDRRRRRDAVDSESEPQQVRVPSSRCHL